MKHLLYAAGLVALVSGLAHAESEPENVLTSDEVVVVGDLLQTISKDDLSSPVSVITTDEINARNQAFLSDLLRSLPGLSVNRSGPGGALTQLRLRGSEASHILVLVDGVEVANPTAGEFDLSGLRSEDIVKIELLRGEQSALYGSDAVGGVLNIITHSQVRQESFTAMIEAGSFNTLNGQVSAVIPLGHAALSVSGGGLTTDGYNISGPDESGNGEEDGSTSQSINVGLNGVSLGPVDISAKLALSRLDTEFDEDTDFNGGLDDTQSETQIDQLTARLDGKFTLIGFETRLTASLHDITTDTRGGFSSRSKGRRESLKWVSGRDIGNGRLTVLGETESESYDIVPSFAAQPTSPKNRTYALAGDYRHKADAVTLNISARHDFNDRFENATTWKIGGNYDLDPINGRLRASIGTGVKNPSLIELFGFYPESNFVGNPDLQPETSTGYSLGYEQTALDDALQMSVDYFYADLEDEIFTDFSTFPFLPRNRTTDSKREGVEIEARWDINSDFNVRGSATFLDSEENGEKEIRRPEFLASATMTWSPIEQLSFTLSVDHTGEQLDTDFASFSNVELDAFTLVGLNAAYDMNDVVTLTLRGENLFDETYQEVVGYASQGRGIYAGLKSAF